MGLEGKTEGWKARWARFRRSTFASNLTLLALILTGTGLVSLFRARGKVKNVRDVVYVPGSLEPKHQLDLYLPIGQTHFPMLLFVHGGYWKDGDRRVFTPITGLYANVGKALAAQGIGAAVISYRLRPTDIHEQMRDVAKATRWLVDHSAHYGGDPERLVLMGHSAGGHLVSLLGLDPRHLAEVGLEPARIRGYISLAGVLDVEYLREHQNPADRKSITDSVFTPSLERVREFSPLTYLTSQSTGTSHPPLLILLGEYDYPNLYTPTHALVDYLYGRDLHPRFFELPGQTHEALVFRVGGFGDLVLPKVLAFVREVCGR